mmetsp:Transcript_88433/g.245553  ORF Transcript_88433/g.245553 Transcript_88433/m.245553 type:complete len:346 (-) Transcript_88433:1240-2277(-)
MLPFAAAFARAPLEPRNREGNGRGGPRRIPESARTAGSHWHKAGKGTLERAFAPSIPLRSIRLRASLLMRTRCPLKHLRARWCTRALPSSREVAHCQRRVHPQQWRAGRVQGRYHLLHLVEELEVEGLRALVTEGEVPRHRPAPRREGHGPPLGVEAHGDCDLRDVHHLEVAVVQGPGGARVADGLLHVGPILLLHLHGYRLHSVLCVALDRGVLRRDQDHVDAVEVVVHVPELRGFHLIHAAPAQLALAGLSVVGLEAARGAVRVAHGPGVVDHVRDRRCLHAQVIVHPLGDLAREGLGAHRVPERLSGRVLEAVEEVVEGIHAPKRGRVHGGPVLLHHRHAGV